MSSLKRNAAEKLIKVLMESRSKLDEAEVISREIQDEEKRREFVKLLGHASLDIYTEIIGQIVQVYPDLEPYPPKNKK